MAEESKSNQQTETETAEAVKNIVKVEDTGPCKKKIQVEVPEEKIKALLDAKYKELRRDAAVPGFRRGRECSWYAALLPGYFALSARRALQSIDRAGIGIF